MSKFTKNIVILTSVLSLFACQSALNSAPQKVEPAPTHITPSIDPIVMIHPKYPKSAARIGQNGWVQLSFDINKKGRVENTKVVNVSPKGFGFEDEALRAFEKWRYNPTTKSGDLIYRKDESIVITFKVN